jgi:hypothetical protein
MRRSVVLKVAGLVAAAAILWFAGAALWRWLLVMHGVH